MIYRLTGAEDIRGLWMEHSIELALLEDAYITSSYIPRDFRVEETARVKKVADEMSRVVREALDRASQV